ncbi:Conserved hypothetical protein CHP00255 [Alkalidesulfovibrio alkalitolerans DSM 16529]|jgi:uncharacterized protein (TIGR00255 family)|uniref:YicC-like domain-containing protein n=1 Tax=Alkalidesulfovibrio alkalitolerans DSM 16529 TaxID=1121439 RepID=S7UBW8_9BACT|nr:YicC/YloC family endoribonuclease [Alkalidesulfovibrio alkalitolerans]EPR31384.1 Conserved hypothetical protein CHP00255 [Alkalidesulfovibrio alkalitolerans DSM 16529]
MTLSMTGFGRAEVSTDSWTVTFEVKSVNSRYLDMKWRTPYALRGLEGEWERIVRAKASRGRLECTCHVRVSKAETLGVAFNEAQAAAMLDRLTEFARARSLPFTPDLNRLLAVQNLWQDELAEPDPALAADAAKALDAALDAWNRDREREGTALSKDLASRFATLGEIKDKIAARASALPAEKLAVLRERLATLLSGSGIELAEERLCQEAAVMADRLDVSEEMTRLDTHISRLSQVLEKDGEVGKRLDFLLQEAFREINTTGNKAQDPEISRLVVEFKAELEKCREQVQNIE